MKPIRITLILLFAGFLTVVPYTNAQDRPDAAVEKKEPSIAISDKMDEQHELNQVRRHGDFDRPSFQPDSEECRVLGVGNAIFAPDAAALYPPGYQTWVTVEDLAKPLCGRSRPGALPRRGDGGDQALDRRQAPRRGLRPGRISSSWH